VVGPETTATSDAVRGCVEQARRAGYRSVVTNAIGEASSTAFLDAGFAVRERLHLLALDLHRPPAPPDRPLERAGRRARAAAVRVDDDAFDGFWRLGAAGIRDAAIATPVARFRVGRTRRRVVAYAITGSNGDQGYLQRVAVDPSLRRAGWGRALVADGLGWLWRHGCVTAYVNTQFHNDAAVALYESFGFRRLPEGLCVMGREL
jgi:ribosomal protein S18 acetylase RimI-like enzyme